MLLESSLSNHRYPKGHRTYSEDTVGHADDIRQFIKSRLRLGNSKQVEVLRSEILEKSSGIFLWVVLVLNILNSDKSLPIRKIRQHLHSIPPGLNDLFDMILDRDKDNLQELQLCLKWILFAESPLKPQELYFAVQSGCDQEFSGKWDQDDLNMESMEIFVRSSSKGLAELTWNKFPGSCRVQFIHESVRDYLLGRYVSQWSGASGDFLGDSHDILTKGCVAQIVQSHHHMALEFPFLQYAVSNVFRHANTAQQHGVDQRSFLSDFPLQIWVHLKNFDRIDDARYTRTVTLLYILAEQDVADLIGVYSERKSCFDVENERYLAPALAALVTGGWGAVQAFSQAHAECEPPTSLIHRLCEQDRQVEKESAKSELESFQQSISYYYFMLGNESIIFAFLLSSPGFNLDEQGEDGRTPLSWAAEKGHETVVEIFLAKGAQVNLSNDHGQTPISYAAKNGHGAIVKRLLEKGADIESQDNDGKTPLWHAIGGGSQVSILILLNNGANIECRDFRSRTPLWYASFCEQEAVVKLLLEQGANMESQDNRNWTALWYAVDSRKCKSVELLLKNGAKIESKDSSGRTLLSWAADTVDVDIVRVLIENGADIESRDPGDCTPFFSAVKRGDPRIAKVFLEGKADMLSKNGAMGRTPSSLAMELENETIIGLFLERLAAEQPDKEQGRLPPGWWFLDGGRLIIAALLPKDEISAHLGSLTWLVSAIASRFGVICSLLSDKAVSVSSQASWTRLLWVAVVRTDATLTFRLHQVPLLLNPLPFTPFPDLDTILTIIIGKGADFHSKDTTGRTLLSWAVTTPHNMAVIELLLEKGAALESKDSHGRTPLSWAVDIYDNVSVIELLLKRGADIETKDNDGRTPLHIASSRHRNNAVVALLRKYGADMD